MAVQDVSPAQRHIIKRPRLTKLLDEAGTRIILLVAPAGYGKTTLARQWVGLRGRRAFWYRAGAGSTDPVALAQGLATAVADEFPEAQRHLREYLLGATAPDEQPRVLAEVVAEHAVPWPPNVWLVIDDYHMFLGAAASETFLEHFAESTRANILITSREHPTWISARRVLYGEAFEVGRDELAMSDAEATAVLANAERESSRVVELANGWPAVIGLASLLPAAVKLDGDVPSALHDYFAQELFEMLDESVQTRLPLIALPNILDASVLRLLLGTDASRVRAEAIRVGLAMERERGGLEIHPLVRAFLQSKLDEGPPRPELPSQLVQHLIDNGSWDDAFALIKRYDLRDELQLLIAAAITDAIGSARIATIEQWVEWSDAKRIEFPEISLARAELLLRRGELQSAEAVATASAALFKTPALAAEAHLCAGTAAHLADGEAQARAHFTAALRLADSPSVARRALWGQFVSSMLGDDRDDIEALRALERFADATPGHLVRLGQARLIQASRRGKIADAADTALENEALLDHVTDPLIRSGFLNNLADALVMSSRYTEAERVARVELSDGHKSRLSFVEPNALLNLAGARLGRADSAGAAALVDDVESSDVPRDSFLRANIIGLRARIQLSRGVMEGPVFEDRVLLDARPDIRGEALASIALAQAHCGEAREARGNLERAQADDAFAMTRQLIAATRAVLAIREASLDVDARLAEMIETAIETEAYDGLVCAMRAEPMLLRLLLRDANGSLLLRTIAQRSEDATVRSALGIAPPPRPRGELSVREREILSLVAQGLRNAEIGGRLFISPKTVKTHLQNIYEKLDVRSRTEAVVKAKNAGLTD